VAFGRIHSIGVQRSAHTNRRDDDGQKKGILFQSLNELWIAWRYAVAAD